MAVMLRAGGPPAGARRDVSARSRPGTREVRAAGRGRGSRGLRVGAREPGPPGRGAESRSRRAGVRKLGPPSWGAGAGTPEPGHGSRATQPGPPNGGANAGAAEPGRGSRDPQARAREPEPPSRGTGAGTPEPGHGSRGPRAGARKPEPPSRGTEAGTPGPGRGNRNPRAGVAKAGATQPGHGKPEPPSRVAGAGAVGRDRGRGPARRRGGQRGGQRSGSNGDSSAGRRPVTIVSASSRPVAGPRVTPHMPWPPAAKTRGDLVAPMSGRPSVVQGREPTHSSWRAFRSAPVSSGRAASAMALIRRESSGASGLRNSIIPATRSRSPSGVQATRWAGK